MLEVLLGATTTSAGWLACQLFSICSTNQQGRLLAITQVWAEKAGGGGGGRGRGGGGGGREGGGSISHYSSPFSLTRDREMRCVMAILLGPTPFFLGMVETPLHCKKKERQRKKKQSPSFSTL